MKIEHAITCFETNSFFTDKRPHHPPPRRRPGGTSSSSIPPSKWLFSEFVLVTWRARYVVRVIAVLACYLLCSLSRYLQSTFYTTRIIINDKQASPFALIALTSKLLWHPNQRQISLKLANLACSLYKNDSKLLRSCVPISRRFFHALRCYKAEEKFCRRW
jgi:sensor histidine kinase YesM